MASLKHDSYPIIAFDTALDFEKFLQKSHDQLPGIWVKIAKKNTGVTTMTYDEGVLVGLCYGWIDSQAKRFDETYSLIKFTPRGAKSIWSQKNVSLVEQLIRQKKMRAPGLKKVEEAKADNRWERAYAGSKDAEIPADFIKEIKKDPQTYEFFLTLNRTNLNAIYFRLQTAVKKETRDKRLQTILKTLKERKKFY
jgi:uncharacterized protein YdeI (YjbR/CyaY-like superfamily)